MVATVDPLTVTVVLLRPLVKPFLMWKGDAVVNKLVQRYPDNLFWQRASRALRVARGEEPRDIEPAIHAESL